ncbi:MAG TPA: KEOPS complex subunit Pcc1 [archaeon]|nr:KEOPS complex subunit Pcc1 [archaeon]
MKNSLNEFSLKVNLFLENEKKAKIIQESIEPELNSVKETRSKTSIKVNKNVLSLIIEAKDKTALRASMNLYLRLILASSNAFF